MVRTEVTEFHTRDFYAGNGPWRSLTGPDRAEVISAILAWLGERRHRIVYSAVDKKKFELGKGREPFMRDIRTLWRFMAVHLCLAIQKASQTIRANKGHTLMVFDKEEREAAGVAGFIAAPPEWTDSYYQRSLKKRRLDQIIDVPYFADSRHVGLIQLADCLSFLIRRYLELHEGAHSTRYPGEWSRIGEWVTTVLGQSLGRAMIYPAMGRCPCADLFYRYAPASLTRTSPRRGRGQVETLF